MKHSPSQRGSAMIEFAVVGPMITLLGLAVIQYAMLFFAKNQINHASFMAARSGSLAHASLSRVHDAYVQALIPLYGGGRNAVELAQAQAKASADVAAHTRIELLNPTKESFDDWNDPALQKAIGKGKRVIPNGATSFKKLTKVGPTSGQNLSDANLIKLRITQGYAPKVPLMAGIYSKYLRWLDPHTDAFHTQLVQEGRIPVVANVTLQMHSDAIEPDHPVSSPGPGNNGHPTDPGDPPVTTDPPPDCVTIGCTVDGSTPTDPPPCDPATDPNGCLPPGCQAGDPTCDPACGTTMCCVAN